VVGQSDYVQYEAVDTEIAGVNLELLCWPSMQPDSIISIDRDGYTGRKFRVKSVQHIGDTGSFTDWTTTINADVYDE